MSWDEPAPAHHPIIQWLPWAPEYRNNPKEPLKQQDDTFLQSVQETLWGPDALQAMALLQQQYLLLLGKPPMTPPKHLAAARANGVPSPPQAQNLFAILPGDHLALNCS